MKTVKLLLLSAVLVAGCGWAFGPDRGVVTGKVQGTDPRLPAGRGEYGVFVRLRFAGGREEWQETTEWDWRYLSFPDPSAK